MIASAHIATVLAGVGVGGALQGGRALTCIKDCCPRWDSLFLKHIHFIFIVDLSPLEAARDILFVSFSVKPPSFSMEESMICKQTPPCTKGPPYLKAL